MILIECFTEAHVDNVAACLRLRPQTMVMVGDASEMATPVQRYEKLFKERRISVDIRTCDVKGKDFSEMAHQIYRLMQEEEDYVIDLTGGDERVIMAVGAVVAGLDAPKRARVRVEKYDHSRDVIRDFLEDNNTVPAKPVTLTVEELVALHGGVVLGGDYQPDEDVRLTEVDALWKLASSDPKTWNDGISTLNELESWSDSRKQVFLRLAYIPDGRDGIRDLDEKVKKARALLDELGKIGVIRNWSREDVLEYTYTSSLLRYSTQKAGNILEVKTLLEGRNVKDQGAPYFRDCQMSVSIDWDGEIHGPWSDTKDTRNEIDVVLMHGTTPLFISCKNGKVDEDELYKLNTVADRFGGPYAKKMLVATDLEQAIGKGSVKSFEQRAKDMDILLITNAAELAKEKWREAFQKAME